MGKFLHQYVDSHYRIRLERRSYILGNILPDYCPSFLLRPHYLRNNAVHVQHIIRLLLSRSSSSYNDKRSSRLLGIVCHFYADFFCYAHGDSFPGGLSEHIAYENRLCRYFEENLEQFGSIRFIAQAMPVRQADDIYRQFEDLYYSYLLSNSSLGNDLLYAMTACVNFIVLISGYTSDKEQTDPGHFHNMEAV